jgi:hypothetical protein
MELRLDAKQLWLSQCASLGGPRGGALHPAGRLLYHRGVFQGTRLVLPTSNVGQCHMQVGTWVPSTQAQSPGQPRPAVTY